ncbi:hypothetical protein CDAR_554011 [Caerostris darwini]|uniref:RNase H type-1 domain-containing protein n=1 Tax=Caerostris darwini TaxID=1538125 RepID=A0AAV4X7T6_9ARAC|nr:hypothetical protein CDAR_554011 [Caerostris darwini]
MAISALSNNSPTDSPVTVLAELLTIGWALHLQRVPCHVGVSGNERIDIIAKCGAESNQPEFPLTLRTACTHRQLHQQSLKDLSRNKKCKCLATGCRILMHLEHTELLHVFVLQPAMTTCRHTSTALVWFRMGSAHYVGSLILTATACGTAIWNLSICLMTSLHATRRLGVVWLNSHRRV